MAASWPHTGAAISGDGKSLLFNDDGFVYTYPIRDLVDAFYKVQDTSSGTEFHPITLEVDSYYQFDENGTVYSGRELLEAAERDISGAGTVDNPFEFADGRDYISLGAWSGRKVWSIDHLEDSLDGDVVESFAYEATCDQCAWSAITNDENTREAIEYRAFEHGYTTGHTTHVRTDVELMRH